MTESEVYKTVTVQDHYDKIGPEVSSTASTNGRQSTVALTTDSIRDESMDNYLRLKVVSPLATVEQNLYVNSRLDMTESPAYKLLNDLLAVSNTNASNANVVASSEETPIGPSFDEMVSCRECQAMPGVVESIVYLPIRNVQANNQPKTVDGHHGPS